jgi:prepilin-type N-terminal cleavage/methylation domain-containing protein
MNEHLERARREDSGFTLIELMIVIVILAILAGIVLFAVGGVTDRGTSAACKTDLSTVSTAVEAYYAKVGSYPQHLVPDLTDATLGNQFLRWQPSFTGSTSAAGPASDQQAGTGYTIDYQGNSGPDAGQVWVNGSATGTCP